jgi:cytochrome c-type biogenesis protein CcmH
MSLGPVLYYFIGAGSALIAMLFLFQLEPGMARRGVARRVGAAAILVLPAVLTLFAARARTPVDVDQAQAIASPPMATAGASGMKEDADWAMITHAFMGGPPPGTSTAAPAAGDATQRAQMSVTELDAVTRREPGNVEAWLALGRAHRMAREFAPAASAYESALKLDSRNADAWADYADALASANGRSLAGKPARAIERALQIDPNHLKALWLAASLDLEEHRYKEAVERWQKLRSVLPDGSPDVSIIEANIAEARQLAGQVAQASPAK